MSSRCLHVDESLLSMDVSTCDNVMTSSKESKMKDVGRRYLKKRKSFPLPAEEGTILNDYLFLRAPSRVYTDTLTDIYTDMLTDTYTDTLTDTYTETFTKLKASKSDGPHT